jgi:SAM-dependent methyltransferase
MAQGPLKKRLMALLPSVRSLQQERDTLAKLAEDLSARLAQAEERLRRTASAPPVPSSAASDVLTATPTHHFKGYDIPVDLMEMTGGGPGNFDLISKGHIDNLRRWVGLQPEHTVLEIGCGIGRDAIPLTEILTEGRYVGIDIIKRSIDWCRDNIARKNPNFTFYDYDVKDQLHNPGGTIETTDIRIPLADESVDRIVLFSVFTHMFQSDIEHYLREFRRVLKPSGLVYATTFLFNDEILEKARATNLTPFDLRFEHEINSNCRINTPSHPLGAVAYSVAAWDEMIAASGMRYAKPFLHGAWSGFYADPQDGQDVAILARGPS